MPHVIVKLWPGKSERQKQLLAKALAQSVQSILNYEAESVSVGLEEVSPQDWLAQVYLPDIEEKQDTLYVKPGYAAADLGG